MPPSSRTSRPSSATRPSTAAPRPSSARPRPQSSNYDHPYLSAKTIQPPTKKELGLCDLFFVKLFRCFVADELPPPNPNAPLFQADKDKSSSTSMSLTNTTATVTTTSTNNHNIPQHNTKLKMPEYNRPPPEPVKPPTPPSTAHRPSASGTYGHVRREPFRNSTTTTTTTTPSWIRDANGKDRASMPLGPRLAPGSPHAATADRHDEVDDDNLRRQTFGKVSSLSSMFENNG